MGFLSTFLYRQLFVTLPVPIYDFTGQTVIITGSNTGLGLEAARHVSRLNAKLLILAVRDLSKGASARASILATTHRPNDSIEVWHLDMNSSDSVKSFAGRASKLDRLDAVLENAGMQTKHFKLFEGYESAIMTNVISTFLLALVLLPKLRETSSRFNVQPRLSIVASEIHFVAKFAEGGADDIFAALNDEKSALGMTRYADSKLIEIFAVRELAALVALGGISQPSKVVINCLTPGACQSEIGREATGFTKLFGGLMYSLIGRKTEAGSRALVASIAAGEESHGQYMADCHIDPPSAMVLSLEGQKLQKKVWTQLSAQLEKIQPGISETI